MRKENKQIIGMFLLAVLVLVSMYAIVCTLIDNDWTFHNGFPDKEVYAEEYRLDYPEEISAMPCINVRNCNENVQFSEKNAQKSEDNVRISLGMYRLTAYCSCKKCCGKWAENRPLDENGNEIVYGASGARLTAGRSIAVDPSVIPYGSIVIINDHEYEAVDCGSGIDGNCIDIYFDNHQEALNFGMQYAEVFINENQ